MTNTYPRTQPGQLLRCVKCAVPMACSNLNWSPLDQIDTSHHHIIEGLALVVATKADKWSLIMSKGFLCWINNVFLRGLHDGEG